MLEVLLAEQSGQQNFLDQSLPATGYQTIMGEWTLFSNHGHVLFCLAGDNEARLRDVASAVGITERAVQKIVKELQEGGYISVTKHGRCNRYRVNGRKSLRHPIEAGCNVARLLQAVSGADTAERAEAAPRPRAEPPADKPVPPAVRPVKETPSAPPPQKSAESPPAATAESGAASPPDKERKVASPKPKRPEGTPEKASKPTEKTREGSPDTSGQGSLF